MNRDEALGFAIKELVATVKIIGGSTNKSLRDDLIHAAAQWAQIVLALRAVA